MKRGIIKSTALLFLCALMYLPEILHAGGIATLDEIEELRWRRQVRIADAQFERGAYHTAARIYDMVLQNREEHAHSIYYKAKSNYNIRNYSQALTDFNRMLAIDTVFYPLTLYYTSLTHKQLGNYEEAIRGLEKFQELKVRRRDRSDTRPYQAKVPHLVAGARFGIEAKTDPVLVELEHLDGVNTPFSDLSPRPHGEDALIHSALRSDTVIVMDEDFANYARVYESRKVGDSWGRPQQIDAPFNTGDFHVTHGQYAHDGSRFYFTRCELTENIHHTRCDIYESRLEGNAWTAGEAVPFNAEDANNTHPFATLNAAGQEVMYFASDREGGQGGMDIWYSVRGANGRWGAARNMGRPVNTDGDEVTPYFDSANGILYFSSNGHKGMGGYDVFKSTQTEEGWSEPENLGYPINSSLDDWYYIESMPGSPTGYLVSNRPGGQSVISETCCDNIWAFAYPPEEVLVRGYLIDRETGEVIEEAGTVRFINEGTGEEVANVSVQAGMMYEQVVDAEILYTLKANSQSYEGSEQLSTVNITETEIRLDIRMDKKPYYPGFVFGTVYYDFDRARLREEARPVLDSLVSFLKSNPEVVVEIGGHTDHIGPEAYNDILSKRRSEAVYNFLIRRDVPKEQLVQKGYGEHEPAAPNTFEDGRDNPEGRQLNRRAEFTVIGIRDLE